MDVYLVSGTHPTLPAAGGVRPYVVGLARSLSRRGHRVCLVGAGPDVQVDYAEFVSVTHSFPLSSYRFLTALWRWSRTTRVPERAIIHAQRPDDLFVTLHSRRWHPTVCTLHGDPARGVAARRPIGKVGYALAEWSALNRASQVISVSETGLASYRARYPGIVPRSTWIPLGIDLSLFRPLDRLSARESLGLDGRPVLLYAGRLEPEKRVDVLVEAAKEIGDDAQILVAGNGTLARDLRAKALGTDIRFLGPVPHEGMPGLYAAADLLVLPSEYEGMPTVALEALACGTPVAATPAGDLPRIVLDGKTGYLFDGTVSGLVAILRDRGGQLSGMRGTSVQEASKYGWEAIADRTLLVYEKALQAS